MTPLKNNRARQFLPFNGLRGFTEQLKKQEEPFEEELPLTDDEAESLNHIVPRLTRGSLIHIRYYHLNQYKTLQGYLQGIDTVHQILHPVSYTHLDVYKRQMLRYPPEKWNPPVFIHIHQHIYHHPLLNSTGLCSYTIPDFCCPCNSK